MEYKYITHLYQGRDGIIGDTVKWAGNEKVLRRYLNQLVYAYKLQNDIIDSIVEHCYNYIGIWGGSNREFLLAICEYEHFESLEEIYPFE